MKDGSLDFIPWSAWAEITGSGFTWKFDAVNPLINIQQNAFCGEYCVNKLYRGML